MQVSQEAPCQPTALPGLNLTLQLHQHPLRQTSSTLAADEKGSFTQRLKPCPGLRAQSQALPGAGSGPLGLCSPPWSHLEMTICTILRALQSTGRDTVSVQGGTGQALLWGEPPARRDRGLPRYPRAQSPPPRLCCCSRGP